MPFGADFSRRDETPDSIHEGLPRRGNSVTTYLIIIMQISRYTLEPFSPGQEFTKYPAPGIQTVDYLIIGGIGQSRTSAKARNTSTSTVDIF